MAENNSTFDRGEQRKTTRHLALAVCERSWNKIPVDVRQLIKSQLEEDVSTALFERNQG